MTAPLEGQPCVVCGTAVRVRLAPWSARCGGCGTWRSTLQPQIESSSLHGAIDTAARSNGLKELRERNNERILDEIEGLRPVRDAEMLDVGPAHGWFMTAALTRGGRIQGVEPEEAIADYARGRGLTVRSGYFPGALDDAARFDTISFNDVLEHIPDVHATLRACAETLTPGGILSVNIPSATGLAFRVACLLRRLGIRGPYLRLWQEGLPSPHVHYFTPAALGQLIEQHGLIVRRTVPLSSVQRRGLWSRLHTVERPSPKSIFAFAALWLAAPILDRPSNSDIVLVLAQAPSASA
ncbi:MAG: methyltransferase [Solirubrobacterales bacterium]|jgi:2-polyprenyl-3-methyl-5-hydroxy-6-metoxy-1,4-benzoquinol methylase|nr:methyltransferase [Solirubrobacterales bacterium]MCW3010783.1 methyltransferase [Solirubrobacterales bacterium]